MLSFRLFDKVICDFVRLLDDGGYSLFEPTEMVEQNKRNFAEIFENFKSNYKFNEELFNEPEVTVL